MADDLRMQQFLEQHLAAAQPLIREGAVAWWENALSGSAETAERAAELSARILTLYADPAGYAFLKSLPEHGFVDPLLARQHNVLLRAFEGEQMPPATIGRLVELTKEVEQEYNNFRAPVSGGPATENDVRQILRRSSDRPLRREAWEGSKAIGGRVAERVVEMVRLRNGAARALGYRDHYAMALTLDELDETRVFAWFDELAARSEPAWRRWKSAFDERQAARLGVRVDDLRPWDYTDQFFQEAPPGAVDLDRCFDSADLVDITRRFYAAIGLPVDEVLARSDLYERPGKSQHAFCTDIDREGDVRVLCNITPSEQWMGTMLHEFGHAVYDVYTDRRLPWLLRGPAHALMTEAIAELMGRFSTEGEWLRLYADVPSVDAGSLAAAAREETRGKHLVMTRWTLVVCHFERAMYRDPEQDLGRLWWDLVERYQGIRRPEGRREPDWAAKLHLALAPAYYQNYLLGEMVAAQMLRHLRQQVLVGQPEAALFTSPAVGRWLQDSLFRQGAVRRWEDALEHATGERLNATYYASYLDEVA